MYQPQAMFEVIICSYSSHKIVLNTQRTTDKTEKFEENLLFLLLFSLVFNFSFDLQKKLYVNY